MRKYAHLHRLKFNIKGQLGEGTDGAVWATSNNSVIKIRNRGTFDSMRRSRRYTTIVTTRMTTGSRMNPYCPAWHQPSPLCHGNNRASFFKGEVRPARLRGYT